LIPPVLTRQIQHRPKLVGIIDNIGWLTVDKLLRMGLGVVVSVWIARYLGPEGFGLISYATAFVGVFGTLATFGLQSIVVRDLVKEPDSEHLTLGTAAILKLAGGLFAFGLMVAAISWARPDDALARLAVVILGSVTVFKATDVATYWFEARVQSKYVVWARSSVFVAFVGIKVALILLHAAIIDFVWAMFWEVVVTAAALIAVFIWKGPGLRKLQARPSHAAKLLKDSWPLALAGIAVVIYMKIDQIMLGQMIGNEAVGVYSAAVRVSEVWYFIPMAIVASVFPAIIAAKNRGEAVYYKRLQELYDLMVLLALAVAIPMTFLSGPAIVLLFGPDYHLAGAVLAVHIWAAVFVFLGVASGRWFIIENRQILSLQRTGAGACVNVGLNLVLIPAFGLLGAAWATVISQATAGLFYDVIQSQTRGMYHMKMKSLNLFGAIRRVSNAHL
jgi:O-antigen/teichoic acid export membrane protein